MPNPKSGGWKTVAVVAAVVGAFLGGLAVARSGGDQKSNPDGSGSSSSAAPDASKSPTEQGDDLARKLLGADAGEAPEAIGSVEGSVTSADGDPQPAVAEVLGVDVDVDGASTLVTWRLRAKGDEVKVPAETFLGPPPTSSGTDGVQVLTDQEILRPLRRIDGTAKACMCSEAPTVVDRDGLELSGLYPALGADVETVEVRIPGFPPVKDLPVTRGAEGGDQGQPGSGDLPVLGTFELQHNAEENRPPAFGAVHGVRRLAGATALYLSFGYPSNATDELSFKLAAQSSFDSLNASPRAPFLLDAKGRQEYTALFDRDGACLCTDVLTRNAAAGAGGKKSDAYGKLFVFAVLLPELPAGVSTIDVGVGDSVVRGVAVEEGPLTPLATAAGPVRLGEGWPAVDLAAVATAPPVVFPLTSQVSNLTGDVTTVEQPDEVAVALATDVLFALDSAVLSPEAAARLQLAASVINQRAAGTVTIVGHTDDTGTDEHNDQLSLARAEAVRAALVPLITASGVTLAAEGRGEREPVADNATESGRQANRRVLITFQPK